MSEYEGEQQQQSGSIFDRLNVDEPKYQDGETTEECNSQENQKTELIFVDEVRSLTNVIKAETEKFFGPPIPPRDETSIKKEEQQPQEEQRDNSLKNSTSNFPSAIITIISIQGLDENNNVIKPRRSQRLIDRSFKKIVANRISKKIVKKIK